MGWCCCWTGSVGGGDKGSKVEDAGAGDGKEKAQVAKVKVGQGQGQGAVLVELFTSQGCDSCPPVDVVMSRVAQERAVGEVAVVVLSYHVDIWDHLGWRDPFGSSAWSQRHRSYAEVLQQDSIYTPQAVVQGSAHCVGGMGALTPLVTNAQRFPTPHCSLTFSRPSPSTLLVTGSISPRFSIQGFKVDVLLALYENNLVTKCTKGENAGRTLTNDSVVRSLHTLCTLDNLPSKKSSTNFEVEVPLWESFSRSRLGAALFLQNPSTRQVYAAQHLDLPQDL